MLARDSSPFPLILMIRANFLAAPFALEDPQLRRPIRQGQAKPVDVGIAREQFRDNCDLAVAAIDSCRYLNALGFDLIERPAVLVQRGFLGQLLSSPANNMRKNDARSAPNRQLFESEGLIVGRHQNPHGAQDCQGIKWVWTPVTTFLPGRRR